MRRLLLALVALFSILSISCEIGLGASVDTDPPSLSINNPPVDAVIRDDFAISGTWSDDGTIASVSVELSRTDGKGSAVKYSGTFIKDEKNRGSGTWYSEIPAKANNIADGTYQAVVTIKDATDRTTTQSTTFTIDNTPPVIVLQRPGTDFTATLSNADTYGQVFSLEGLGADDSNIDHIDVIVYGDKDKTDYKTTVTLSNVPPSISLDVAKYGEAAYTAIYGNVDPKDFQPAQYYCTIRAYDTAARYPLNPDENSSEDSLGNSTDVYYIYEDISKNILKDTKITEIYRILSGAAALDNSYSASRSATIISNLSANEKTIGSFVLDPKNNPTYSIVGKPSLLAGVNAECLKEESDYTVPNGSDITILAAIGLDNSPIVNDDSFKVYFQEAEFVNGKYTGTGEKIYPVIDSENGKKKIGSNYQFAVTVQSSDYDASVPGSGLVVSKPYIIGVEGVDENGKPFLPANNGYGFYLVSLSSAPTLKDITPSDNTIYIKAGDDLEFTGKTKLTEGQPTVTIRYDDEEWCTTGALSQLVAGKTDEYEFDITVPASKFATAANNKCKEFQIEIRSSNGGKSSSTYKTVMYDVNAPEISELTITPEIKDANDDSIYLLNGEIAVKAMLEDKFTAIKKWHYEISQEDTDPIIGAEQTTSKVEFTYDTKSLTDEKAATIKIIAEDKAGNVLSKEISCYVDQKTDRPSFEAQDGKLWKSDVKNPYFINKHKQDTDALKTNIISGNLYSKVIDDDSVAYVRFEVEPVKLKDGITEEQKADKTFVGYEADTSSSRVISDADIKSKLYSKEGKETSVTHKMPANPGFYLVTQTVYDKNFVFAGTSPEKSDENAANKYYYTKASYVLKVSGTGPQYTLTPSTTYISRQKTDKQLTVTINIESGEGPYTIQRNEEEPVEIDSTSYVDTFTVANILTSQNGTDTTVKVNYLVSDMNGDTPKILSFSSDETPPSFANLKIDAESEDFSVYKHKISQTQEVFYLNNQKQSFTVSGLASDTVGVEKVCLKIENTDGSGTTIEKEESTGYFTGIRFADFDSNGVVTSYWNGGAKVTVTVYDTAGNTSTPQSLDILFDCEVPEIEHDIDDSLKNLRFRIGNFANENGDLDVGGKYSNGTYGSATSIMIRGFFPDNEGGSGINKYYYWVSRKEVKIDDTKTGDDAYKVGTGSETNTIFFKNEAALTDYVVQNNTDTFSPLAKNETKRVEYNINDAHKDAEKAKYADDKPNPENIEFVDDKNKKNGYWQFRKDVLSNFKTTIKGFEEGSNYLVIVAEDNVGNVRLDCATVSEVPYPCYSLNVDVNAPSITEKIKNDFSKVILTNGSKPENFEFYVVESTSQIKDDAFTVKLGSKTLTITPKSSIEATVTDAQKKLLNIVEVGTKNAEDKYLVKLQIGTEAFTGLSGNQSLQVVVKDEAYNSSSATIIGNLNVDNDAPSIQITSDSAIDGYIKDSISADIYVNDLNGIDGATDTTGGKVYYNVREKNASSNLLTNDKSVDINKNNGTAKISITKTDYTLAASKSYVLVVSATDKAGNTQTITSGEYKVDQAIPEFVDLKVQGTANTALGTSHFKDTTLTITGSFKDENGSGVKLIHYTLNGGEEKTVTPTLNEGKINYDYSANVGVFNENNNTLVIWAEDAVGNEGSQGSDTQKRTFTVKIDTTAPEITEKSEGDFDNTQLTNGSIATTFDFNVEEKASGITQDKSAFNVKLGTKKVDLTTADSEGKNSYVEVADAVNGVYAVTLHIGTDAFTSLNGNKSLKVSVKDNLGNLSSDTVVGNINKDKTFPEPSFTYPKYGTKNGQPDKTKIPEVNKSITIEGKIKEANAIDEITLTATPPSSDKTAKTFIYKRKSGEGETNSLNFDVDTKEWSVDVDTYVDEWNKTANIEKWTLSISVKDEAGNTGTETQEININQDSDRPVITLNSLTLPSTYEVKNYQTTELSGYLRDDDGESKVPASMKYRIGSSGAFVDTNLTYSDETGQFTLNLGDAEQNVYFEITDTEGGVFTTKVFTGTVDDEDLFVTPKLTDKSGTKYGYMGSESTVKNTVLKLKVDTHKPEISSWHFTRTPDKAGSWATAISTENFGGSKNTFYLKAEASDSIVVEKVYLSIPVKNKSSGDETKDGVSAAITSWVYTDENKITHTLYTAGNNPTSLSKVWEDIDIVGDDSKAKTVTITAVDPDFTDLTIGSNAYTRTAYIFPLEDTEPSKDDNAVHIWQSPYDKDKEEKCKPVDVSGLLSGTRTASLYAYDGTSNSNPNTVTISIDNTPPVISFSGPAEKKTLSGGITAYGGVDSAEKVYYAVSTSKTIHPDASGDVDKWYDSDNIGHKFTDNKKLNENEAKFKVGTDEYKFWGFKEISRSTNNSWSVEFDGTAGDGEHQQTLKEYLKTYKITDEPDDFDLIVLFYIWIKAEDECGNISWAYREVNFDPQGDRPTISFSYPSSDGETYKDKPQISGSTTDPASNANGTLGIESIWLQIVSTKHSKDSSTGKTYGSFTVNSTSKAVENLSIKKADLDYLASLKDSNGNNLYNIFNMKTYHTESNHTPYNGSGVTDDTAKNYAIRIAPGGYSWLATINAGGELDFVPEDGATGNDKINQVAVRVYAQDKDGKLSLSQDRYMIFDSQSPAIGNKNFQSLYLIQSDSVDITTESGKPDFGATASKEYKEDGYVRGNWYLIGSVDDNDKIKDLKIDNKVLAQYNSSTTITSANQIQKDTNGKWATWTSTDAKVVYFKYKVDTSGVGEKKFKIEVEDQAETPNDKEIKIKFDNTAPELVGAGDAAYNISPAVKQNNGFYTFGSKVKENPSGGVKQSGLDFVAFYFMRRNKTADSEVDTVYNPIASSNSTDITAANISYDSGLYWFKKTVDVDGNKLTFTKADSDVKYIRENGLVKIKGSLYKVKKDSKKDTSVELIDSTGLDANPPANATEAYFALALLSDNTKAEKGNGRNTTTFYPNTITGDDGDGFIDSVDVTDSGATYTWSAEIVSKNIPDGPIELHYVAFDKAGNYSIGIMGTKSEAVFKTSTDLATTGDRTEYKNLVTNTNRTSNVLYVDGAYKKSHYNGTASDISPDSNFADAAYVRNNAPRLAAVKIWTDYDGNGSEGSGESKTKYVSQLTDVSGNLTPYAGGATSTFIVSRNDKDYKGEDITGVAYMTIRDKTEFTPEIVGGNGVLKYQSRIAKAGDLEKKEYSPLSGDWITGTNVQVEDDKSSYMNTYVDLSKTRKNKITFGADAADWTALGSNSTEDDPYWFEYKIWDSTDGATCGTDSLSAVMRIALDVQYFDSKEPWARIRPFYWNSSTENSLEWGTDASGNRKALGHIELEKDVNAAMKAALGEASATVLDPKVSGKIKVEGYVFDNIRLKEIYAQFAVHAGLGGTNFTKIAEYKNGSWGSGLSGTGWSATVQNVYSNAKGHMAKFTLILDTESVADDESVAALNRVLKIYAVDDRGGNSSKSKIGSAQTSNITARKWSSVKGTTDEEKKTALATYFTDVTCMTPVTTETKDDTIVYNASDIETYKAYYQMDVVPYITGIETTDIGNSGIKENNIRSASGKYSILSKKSETANLITVHGFNFGTLDAKIATVSPNTTSAAPYGSALAANTANTAATVTDKTVVALDISAGSTNVATIKNNTKIKKSGYLELFSDGIRALNNINDNDAYGTAKNTDGVQLSASNAQVSDYANAYNREPDYYSTKNVKLTDDRYLIFFEMHTAQTPKATNQWKDLKNAFYPVMVMNGDNPVFGYMNGSGGPKVNTDTAAGSGAGQYEPSHAMPQRAEFDGSSGAEIYTEYLIKASAWDSMGMAVDEGNRYYNVSCYNRDGATMSLIYDRYAELYNDSWEYDDTIYYNPGAGWGSGTGYSAYKGNWSYNTSNNAITLDSMNYGGEVLLGRYMYPKLIAKGNSKTGTAKVYMAYYDDGTGEIAFRDFQLGTTVSGTAKNLDNTHTAQDGTTTYKQKINFTENSNNPGTSNGKRASIAYNTGRHAAVAKGSKYYDMGVTRDNHVVIVYYDETDSCLKMVYSTGEVTGSEPTATVGWTSSSVKFPRYTGNYVSMVIDSNNGIHIAAFDASDADLKYLYLNKYSSTDLVNVKVDAAGSVGHWTGIAICNDEDNPELNGKPVISYYNSTETGTCESIKLAYPNAEIGSITAGIGSDGYTTGAWEYMTVPTITPPQGGDSKFQKVCLGFDTKGIPVLGYCATNLEFGKQLRE